jgi:nitrate reductase NapAB chaperone NapD
MTTDILIEETDKAISKERERLILKLVSNSAHMAADYKNTIKHTGGLLTASMVYAYSKGLNDALKLLTKEDTNDQKAV